MEREEEELENESHERKIRRGEMRGKSYEGEMWVDVGILIEGPFAGCTVAGYPD